MAQEEKFELLKLDTNNLVEFEGWENRMKKVVEENPFIEIIDKETYKTAKKRLSNVRAERVSVENQDKSIATFVTAFRKKTMTKKDELVIIVKPLEDELKTEVDRYEKLIQDEKDEEARIETLRVDGINHEIKRVEDLLDEVIEDSELSEINAFKLRFEETKESEFDFEEYKFMFDEMVEAKTNQFNERIIQLEANETTRLEQLKKDREARLNQMIIDGMELVDSIDGSIEERLVKQMVTGIFQTIIGEGVDFDAETFERMNQAKQKTLVKVDEKFKALKQQEIAETKHRISEVKEGLLDLVFQMTIVNMDVETEKINKSLDQVVIDEVKEDFDIMKSIVSKALNQKRDSLIKEFKANEKALEIRNEKRFKDLVNLGFVEIDEKQIGGFGETISKLYIKELDDDGFEYFFNELIDVKSNSEKEKARQERIRRDKINLVQIVVNLKNEINSENPKECFEHQESKDFFKQLKKEFIEYCDERITNINKF